MSATMRAVTLRAGRLELKEVPRPVPGPGQLLVRTLACAICASDHHYVDHPEVARDDRSGMRVHAPDEDVIMGHEFCAEVVAYGPDTRQEWPVGTRVTSTPALFVDGGLRIIGMAPDAPGGFGEYLLLSEGFVVPLPDDLAPERLALIDAMAVGWYYTRVGVAVAGAVPLVVGLGAIGQSVVVSLKQRGVGPIVASDFSARRREMALRLGADVVVDPATESVWDAWRRAAWGAPDEVHDRIALSGLAPCVAYECVGASGVLADIVENCPVGTRVLSAGGAGSDTIPSATAHLKGVNLQFGGGPAITDWLEMAELVATGRVDPSPLVGETVGLDGLADAIDRARSPEGPMRIVWVADS
ncbi:MAG TPA: alcohol dehydrogenase catalytic domain-containing protein [Nocardioides sp.]|uniref:alcohol dehydrogenase catalytic domain-containing protein n=1 Tax=Nocardioides sp. TaxID=35761 RepID=UPI002C66523F|nr:alcohol dehydrogenase catalytic domain-containing protein [Nocardioides sp.]HTW14371.1 alcohol dehydrogenase catalytic domain-containing protein [Nocardioides sp.]